MMINVFHYFIVEFV